MRQNLLTFLFGDAVVRESSQTLGEEVVRLFEEAADQETEEMVANKTPLAAALRTLGIEGKVEAGPQCACLHCDNAEDYRKYCEILFDPENLHALATKGWVAAKSGDQAMSFEPADFKISFIELATAELSTTDKAPDDEKIRKDAQKFASTEVDHDDSNPVEFDDKTSSDNQKGVGKATDGKDPEGKPKGSTKQTEAQEGKLIKCPNCGKRHACGTTWCPCGQDICDSPEDEKGTREWEEPQKHVGESKRRALRAKGAKHVAESLLEMTGTASIGTFEGPPPAKPNWADRLEKLRKRRGDKRNADSK